MKHAFQFLALAALLSCVPARSQPAPVLADPVTGVLTRPSAALFKSANSIGTGEGGLTTSAIVSDNGDTTSADYPSTTTRIGASFDGQNILTLLSYGANTAFVSGAAGGTKASPTQTTAGTSMLILGGIGYNTTTGWGGGTGTSSGRLSFDATENHTSTAFGTKATIAVTANGSTTRADVAEFTSSGMAITGDLTLTGSITSGAWAGSIIEPAYLGVGSSIGTKFLRGDGTWQTLTGGGDALAASPLSQFAATTSAQLAGVLTDETGTGGAVLAVSPTLTTPNLGTPSALTLTNATGLPTAGMVDASVTLAKMDNLAQDQFIGRTTASTGAPETATITAAARTVLDDTTVAAMVDTLGGASSTGTGGLVRTTNATLTTPNLGIPSAIDLTNALNLPGRTVAQGGTGLVTLTSNNIVIGNGTGSVNFLAPGTSGNIITSNGTAWASTTLDADLLTWAGVTPSANGQSLVAAANYAAMRTLLDLEAGTDFLAYPTGTPTGSKYLRDDNTWQAITGGDVTLTGTNVYTAGSSTFNSGTTFAVNGTFGGTPTGGTLDLSAVTVSLGSTTVDTLNVTAFGTGTLLGANGGTGVANTGKTITLGGNLTTSGAYATTLTSTATTNATLPAGTTTLASVSGDLGTPSAAVLTNATGLPLSTGVTGNLPVANLNSGTSASSSTYWRGDGTWATPSGGSGTAAPGLWPTADIASPPSGYFAAGEYGTTANTALGAWSIIVPSLGTVANPTVDIAAGAVPSGTVITFSSATSTPFFTSTNNTTDPTYTVGDVGATRTISGNQTVEVVANKLGYVSSGVESFAYTIDALPTLTSTTVETGGTDITLLFSEAVRIGAGGSGGWVPTLSGGAATFTYASGNTTTSLVYTSNRTINSGETGTIAYTQPGNGIEENAGYNQDVATIPSATITNNSTAGGISYDTQQDFEGSGATGSGWAGSGNWDYTTTILAGSQSGHIDAAFEDFTYTYGADKSTVYGKFIIRPTSARTGTNYFLRIRNSSSAVIGLMEWHSSPAGCVRVSHGTALANTSFAMAQDTTHYVWFEYTSGASGTFKLWIDTVDTKPTGDSTKQATIAPSTSGMATTDIRSVQMRNDNTAYFAFDNFELAQVAIP